MACPSSSSSVFACDVLKKEAGSAAAKLHHEGLLGFASGLHTVAVVQEQFKGICGDGDVAKADDMVLDGINFRVLLEFVTEHHAAVDMHPSGVLIIEDLFVLVLLDVVFQFPDSVLILSHGDLPQGQVQINDLVLEEGGILQFGDLLIDGDNFIGDALTHPVAAADIVHRGVSLPLQGVRTLHIGIIDGGFGGHPANQVTGALVARGAAEGQEIHVLTQLFDDEINPF